MIAVMGEKGLLRRYIKESRALKRDYPRSFHPLQLVVTYPRWRRCLTGDADALKDQQPWITFSAIRFLDRFLTREMRVFEYGTGGSTLYFARRVGQIVSVEHDKIWLDRVADAMADNGLRNWTHRLIPPEEGGSHPHQDPADADSYASSDPSLRERSFRQYASEIDGYGDGYFDLVLVDGRARPSCFKHAVGKVRGGGWVLWDNTDRPHYRKGMDLAPPEYRLVDFPGPSPYVPFFTRTTGWLVPDAGPVG